MRAVRHPKRRLHPGIDLGDGNDPRWVTVRFRPFLLAVVIFVADIGKAGQPIVVTTEEEKAVEEAAIKRWSGDAGVNVVNAYYTYGILQEDDGFIAQPFADVFYTLFEGKGFISEATIGLSLWSSIHSKETGADPDSSFGPWYKEDLVIPIAVTFAERVTLTASYLEYQFPNGALDLERSVSANLAVDDTAWLGPFALHPHILVLYNFEGIVGIAQSHAWYFEAGVAPGFELGKKSRYPITVTLPVILGMGDQRFYPDDRFGFLSCAANVSVPLPLLADSFGHWTGNAGVLYQTFGDGTAAANLARDSCVVSAGIKWEF